MKNSLLIGLSTTAVTLSIVGLAGMASAQSTSNSTGIIDKIATKFNLNKSDVQAVFDTNKTEQKAARHEKMSDKLQELVDKGAITADQKAKITAKWAEQKTKRDEARTELEKWASDNGIDAKYVMHGVGRGGHGGPSKMQ